jgi:RNA-binding protein 5/10
VEEGFPSDRRGAFGQDIHDRNMYAPPPSASTMWSQPRRNSDEDFATAKDYRRHASDLCNDGKYHEFDSCRI